MRKCLYSSFITVAPRHRQHHFCSRFQNNKKNAPKHWIRFETSHTHTHTRMHTKANTNKATCKHAPARTRRLPISKCPLELMLAGILFYDHSRHLWSPVFPYFTFHVKIDSRRGSPAPLRLFIVLANSVWSFFENEFICMLVLLELDIAGVEKWIFVETAWNSPNKIWKETKKIGMTFIYPSIVNECCL